MKERPILFSGPMVRALLEGSKTQTRRVMKAQPPTKEAFRGSSFGLDRAVADGVKMYSQNDYDRLPKHPTDWELTGSVGVARDAGFPRRYRCPYGQIGDRLWVRETWAAVGDAEDDIHACPDLRRHAYYRADAVCPEHQKWRPSIHMPRWASRLTLAITDIRVERLQDISDRGQPNDCIREGVFSDDFTGTAADWLDRGFNSIEKCRFHDLWTSINGPESWTANPWVWVVTFEVEK